MRPFKFAPSGPAVLLFISLDRRVKIVSAPRYGGAFTIFIVADGIAVSRHKNGWAALGRVGREINRLMEPADFTAPARALILAALKKRPLTFKQLAGDLLAAPENRRVAIPALRALVKAGRIKRRGAYYRLI